MICQQGCCLALAVLLGLDPTLAANSLEVSRMRLLTKSLFCNWNQQDSSLAVQQPADYCVKDSNVHCWTLHGYSAATSPVAVEALARKKHNTEGCSHQQLPGVCNAHTHLCSHLLFSLCCICLQLVSPRQPQAQSSPATWEQTSAGWAVIL
jgi:hypothetical protein